MLQIFAGLLGGRSGNEGRQSAARTGRHRIQPRLEGLECRDLKTASVSLANGLVNIAASGNASNTATVSLINNGTTVDVNLNGTHSDFNRSAVQMIEFNANTTTGGTQSFTNNTGVFSVAIGGAGTNVFTAGTNYDTFIGGTGTNTLVAGTGFVNMFGGNGSNTYVASTGSGLIEDNYGTNNIDDNDGLFTVI